MPAQEGLRVSWDIDDVIVPSAEQLVIIYNEWHGTSLQVEHWNSSRDPEHWGAPTFPEAVQRVNDVLGSERFIETVPGVPGTDKVIARLAQIAELQIAVTGRPEDIRPQTVALLEKHHAGVFPDEKVHFTDFYNKGNGGAIRDKLVIAREFGVTHHVEDHFSHALPLATAGIKVPLFGRYPWNQGGDDDFPPLLTRVGDMDGLGEYFEDEYAMLLEYGRVAAQAMKARRKSY